jgi:hypothetical protein
VQLGFHDRIKLVVLNIQAVPALLMGVGFWRMGSAW